MIHLAAIELAAAGIESSLLDAQVLMAAAAGVTRVELISGSICLSPEQLEDFNAMVARRQRREPIAYIVGRKEFYSLEFDVGPQVLIPRPETEVLVDLALEFLATKPNARVLDLGTGSGAIAIAIATNAPNAEVIGSEVSVDACAMAIRNLVRHGLHESLRLRRADCFYILDHGRPLGSFDLIVSNPPYLEDTEIAAVEPEVRNYEPRIALAAGRDGLEIMRRIASGVVPHLRPGGELMVEVGLGQAPAVATLFQDAGLGVVSVINDFAGHPRVVHARKSGA
jgi:release factor glutamine methyltransferase